MSEEAAQSEAELERSDAWTDLALTLPVFVLYHLGVVFLPVRNAADPVTSELKALASESLPLYSTLTLAIGAAFVIGLMALGRGKAFAPQRFLSMAIEGVVYAVIMRLVGGWALDALPLQSSEQEAGDLVSGPFGAVVMSLGAGFYEELAF